MDRDLYRKLGIDPDTISDSINCRQSDAISEDDCSASDECHAICHWLLDQAESAHEQYLKAMKNNDELSAYRIKIGAAVLLEAAEAIHLGVHLG